jgi:hypothetical protein
MSISSCGDVHRASIPQKRTGPMLGTLRSTDAARSARSLLYAGDVLHDLTRSERRREPSEVRWIRVRNDVDVLRAPDNAVC